MMSSPHSNTSSLSLETGPGRWLAGGELASDILLTCRRWIFQQKSASFRAPCLGLIRVGEDPASIRYMERKMKACESVGISSRLFLFSEGDSFEKIEALIREVNRDRAIDGLLLQLPLPSNLFPKPHELINTIAPEKDVDGLSATQQMYLLTGQTKALIPCTAAGIMTLLRHYNFPLEGKNVVLLGRSLLVGRPLLSLLLQANASVTVLHSFSREIDSYLSIADIVIVAVGKAHAIHLSAMRTGSVVIDVGISTTENKKLLGDVSPFHLPKEAQITPVPGGVGPLTVAMLMLNCCRAYAMQQDIPLPDYTPAIGKK